MKNDTKSLRFGSRTSSIDVKKLERETWKFLYLGFIMAVLIHAGAAAFFSFKKPVNKIHRPITVDLIITPPRLTKPYILRKKIVRKKSMYRKEVHYKNPLREFTLKSIPPFLAYDFGDSLKIHRENYFQAFIDSFDVEKPLEIVDVSKKPSYESSLENEILSIEDMDFGKFKSLVVKDPFNKKNIRGFVYMPVSVWGAELTPLARPVIGLAEALKKYTNIESKLDVRILLSSSEVFKFPFLYIITEEAFELNPEERKNFTEYLMYGGFAVLDNGFPQDTHSGAEASLRKMLWDAKTDIGSSAFITIIPLGHPLYHCFFDFFDGPPLGAALIPPEEFASNKQVIDKEYHPVPCLEGLWIDNRLSAIYSDMGYGLRWTQIANNIPQQKIGINMVVYALTRFGGVTYNELTAVSSIR